MGGDTQLATTPDGWRIGENGHGAVHAGESDFTAASTTTERASTTLVGASVGPYHIVARLGAGGMGEVFLAHDSRLKREVALKCLCLADGDNRRILHEARAAAQLNHPNIAAVYDVFEHEGRPFIVMEYVKGESVRERLKRGRLPLTEVLPLNEFNPAKPHNDATPDPLVAAQTDKIDVQAGGRGVIVFRVRPLPHFRFDRPPWKDDPLRSMTYKYNIHTIPDGGKRITLDPDIEIDQP